MNGTSDFLADCGKNISAQQSIDGLRAWAKRKALPQDAQKGRPARPQYTKGRVVLFSVRGASERSENAAGGLFQHPVKKCGLLPPNHHPYRLLHEQWHRFGTGTWHLLRPHNLITLFTAISTEREMVPNTLSVSLPDSAGRRFSELKFTCFRYVWLITLIVVAGLGLASCGPRGIFWIPREDTIHFTTTNPPFQRPYGALIDGKRNGHCLNDYMQRAVDSSQKMYIGNFTESVIPPLTLFSTGTPALLPCPNGAREEIIGFTTEHPPTILDVKWTTAYDYVDLHFQEKYTFPAKVWIVSGDSDDQYQHALHAITVTQMIWQKERQGFAFSSITFDDTNKDDSFAKFTCDSFALDESQWITTGRMQPNAINIYYVDEVISERNGSRFSEMNGFNCYGVGHRDVIVMGSNTAPALLAHELGHAFGIGHVKDFAEFDETNVMHEASDLRTYFTEGQTFRQVILPYSAVNDPTIYKDVLTGQGITLQTPRDCPVLRGLSTESSTSQEIISKCPLLQTRIWPDGRRFPWGRWASYPLEDP